MYACMYVYMYMLVDKALSYHGDLNSREREANLDKIRSGEELFLVCTDIAARGNMHTYIHTYIQGVYLLFKHHIYVIQPNKY